METTAQESRLVYQDQSANDLRLLLVDGRVDPEQFAILGQGSISDGELAVEAGVIGASHYLLVSVGDRHFTEVLACTAVKTDSDFVGFQPWKPPGREYVGVTTPGPVERYRCRFRRLDWAPAQDELRRLTQAVQAAPTAATIGLSCTFPSEGQDDRTPLTIVTVRWDKDRSTIEAETAHAYPNEECVVFTRTEIKIR